MLFLTGICLLLNLVPFLLDHAEFLLVVDGIHEISSQNFQETNVKFRNLGYYFQWKCNKIMSCYCKLHVNTLGIV